MAALNGTGYSSNCSSASATHNQQARISSVVSRQWPGKGKGEGEGQAEQNRTELSDWLGRFRFRLRLYSYLAQSEKLPPPFSIGASFGR